MLSSSATSTGYTSSTNSESVWSASPALQWPLCASVHLCVHRTFLTELKKHAGDPAQVGMAFLDHVRWGDNRERGGGGVQVLAPYVFPDQWW